MPGVKSELGPTGRTVADTVRHHRERLGLTFAQLSRKLTKIGRIIPPLGLARIESGTRRVDADDLVALAIALEVAPISLLMPYVTEPEALVQITGTGVVPAQRAWNWLNGNYPLNGSVLAFYSDALPAWEREVMEEALGATRQ